MKDKHSTKMKLIFSLSMGIFGTLGPFTRQIGVSSGELALYRALLATLLLGAVLLFRREKSDLSKLKRGLVLLLVSGMAMGFNWVLLFEAYKYTTIATATLSYYFAPVIVTVACPFLFREKLTRKQVVCFIMSTVGLVMIIGVGGGSGTGKDGLGIMCALGAAVLYASVIIMNKYIRAAPGIQRTLLQFLGATSVLVPYVVLTGGFKPQMMDAVGVVCLLVVGLVHTGANYCLYFTSLKELDGQTVSILSYIDPLVAVLVSFFVLGESMTVLQIIGGGLILGFTLYNEI